MAEPELYLLDVEGTTSPVSLVSEMLFPYARRHLAAFLRERWAEPEVQADLALLAEESRVEEDKKWLLHCAQDKDSVEAGAAVAYLNWLMDRDRKSTALKSLQGKVWRAGYLSGELVGTVFPDVPPAMERWSRKAKVAIYSSGSVEAQRLIFSYSSMGDLTNYISAYFDTRIGPKTAAESYRSIAAEMGVTTKDILFVSDVVRELNAAREAGCATRLSLRNGNAPAPDTLGHIAVLNFGQIADEIE